MLIDKAGRPYGLISNIQRYTIHDGPGIRTEIFFKGCSLACKWCSNPEGLSVQQELGIYPQKCLSLEKCGLCIKRCPEHENTPLRFSNDGIVQPIRTAACCKDCFLCAEACPADAITVWGKKMTIPELMKIILADRSFYMRSGGGVTLSGGEVIVQWEFASLLLQECVKARINTCVESALNCPTNHVMEVMQYADYIITDIKHMDPEIHRQLTGADNKLILENIKLLTNAGKRMVIRTPVVAGMNNSEESIRAIAAFIRDELHGQVLQYQLLPYRKIGTEKYASLGMAYPLDTYVPPEREEWERDLLKLQKLISEEYGLPAVAGSGQKWQ